MAFSVTVPDGWKEGIPGVFSTKQTCKLIQFGNVPLEEVKYNDDFTCVIDVILRITVPSAGGLTEGTCVRLLRLA